MSSAVAEDISGIAISLRDGSLTSEALVDRCLERIRRMDPRLNSFVALDEAGARAAARASDSRRGAGSPLSALDGVPLSIKDNIWVAGMPATWGSRAFADFVTARDDL